MFKLVKLLLSLSITFQLAYAEELSVDKQFADSQTLEFSLGLDYVNSYSNGLGGGDAVIETFYGDYVTVPTTYEYSSSTDYMGASLSLNYGINDKFSVYSYASYHYLRTRDINSPDSNITKDKQFDSIHIGMSYVIKKETKTPALYVRLSTNATEKVDINATKQYRGFTSTNITLGTYFSTDPITFMFQSTYIANRTLELNKFKQKDGDIFIFSPTVYFSVNPYVTINFDLTYQYINKYKENSTYITKNRSEITKGMGVIYELNSQTTISVDYSYNSSGSSSDSVSMYMTYKL